MTTKHKVILDAIEKYLANGGDEDFVVETIGNKMYIMGQEYLIRNKVNQRYEEMMAKAYQEQLAIDFGLKEPKYSEGEYPAYGGFRKLKKGEEEQFVVINIKGAK